MTLTYVSASGLDISWFTRTLAVGACFPKERLAELAREHRIKAVIDMRGEARHDEAELRVHGIELLHLPTVDMDAATQPMLDNGVAFARLHLDRGERVLVHCVHGIGRSPLLALCVLVDLGFEPLAALEHAKAARGTVSPSEAQYRGWAAWLARHGHPVPDYHAFGCVAYRHLAKG